MIPNEVSATMTEEQVSEYLERIQELHDRAQFLIGLDPQKRKRMVKAGDGSQAFIRKCESAAPHIIDYLPRGLDLAELHKDIVLMDQLTLIKTATGCLHKQICDTLAIVTSEAYTASLEIYRCAKKAEGDIGLQETVRELKRRFARIKPSANDEADEPAEATGPDSAEQG